MNRVRIFVGLLLLVVATTLQADTIEISGRTMGPIEFRAVIHDLPDDLDQESVADQVQSTLDRVNDLMSTYIDESDVSRFNNAEADQWISVSAETIVVVSRANEISRQTDGSFDITVGPAVNLWGFGPKKGDFIVPADSVIESLKPLIGYEKIEIRNDPPALRKPVDGLKIDLSAIAKGYAVDQVVEMLRQEGIENCLVEVGGEVRCMGLGPRGKWRVGIEVPDEAQREYQDIVAISDQSVATSGDYRNFEIVDGQRYSHEIDPRTCRPVEHSLALASVVAEDCMTADALATAVMVMGQDKGHQLSRNLGFLLQTTVRNGEQFETRRSDGFPLQRVEFEEEVPPEPETPSIWPAFIGALVIFGLAVLGMAVGAIFGNKPVRGSCGGLAGSGDSDCGVCSRPSTDCVETPNAETADR